MWWDAWCEQRRTRPESKPSCFSAQFTVWPTIILLGSQEPREGEGRGQLHKAKPDASGKQTATVLPDVTAHWAPPTHTHTRTHERAQPHCTLTENPVRKTGVLLLWPAWEKRYTCECKYLNRPASKNKEGEGNAGPTHPLLSETQTPRGPKEADYRLRFCWDFPSAGLLGGSGSLDTRRSWQCEAHEAMASGQRAGSALSRHHCEASHLERLPPALFLSVTLSSLSIRRVKLVLLLSDLQHHFKYLAEK